MSDMMTMVTNCGTQAFATLKIAVEYGDPRPVSRPIQIALGVLMGTAVYLHSYLSTYRSQRDQAYTVLNQYQRALGSFGCSFNPDDPYQSMDNTRVCLDKVNKTHTEKEVGEAILNSIKSKTSLDLALVEPQNQVVEKIAHYFAAHQVTLQNQKETTQQMNSHLEKSHGTLDTCINQSGRYFDALQLCHTDKAEFFYSSKNQGEKLENCRDELKSSKQKLDTCQKDSKVIQGERNSFATEYQTCVDGKKKCWC